MSKLILEEVTKKDVSVFNSRLQPTLKVLERGFYFSQSASNMFDISKDMYMHLIRAKSEKGVTMQWYVIFNSESKDGYKVCAAKHGATTVVSQAAARLFKSGVACNWDDKFLLKKTKTTHNDCPLIEIDALKPIKQIRTHQ